MHSMMPMVHLSPLAIFIGDHWHHFNGTNGDVMAWIAIKRKEYHERQWLHSHWHQWWLWLGFGLGLAPLSPLLPLAPFLPLFSLSPMASFAIHWHHCGQWHHLCHCHHCQSTGTIFANWANVTTGCQWINIVSIGLPPSPLSLMGLMVWIVPLPPFGDPGQDITI